MPLAALNKAQLAINLRFFHGRLSHVTLRFDYQTGLSAYYLRNPVVIGINPRLCIYPDLVLCALAHELTHHHQCTWGRPSSQAHDHKFAQVMERIGLLPTDGKGNRCGERITDCIVPCGPLDIFIEEYLEKEPGFSVALFTIPLPLPLES